MTKLEDSAKEWGRTYFVQPKKCTIHMLTCDQMPTDWWSYALHLHLFLNRKGRWGTTEWFHKQFPPFFSVLHCLWDLANSRPLHSLMLSSHLFFCLPFLLPSITVSCKMVLTRPDEWEICPYHCSLHLFVMVRRSLWFHVVRLHAWSWHGLPRW